ncbi:tRNA1(Val) (adenine(37)-N6)-methyltransferase [Clostridium cochlearium]|uniref:Methyltransferase n=1 Tax=Clostridium cochlearium TaxID=1494 RepID=A0A239YY60_CLOCO|nr:tRNA1(Val) (adenine(37)-N6)-methyltransferase [Clostridium cochlearium]MBE6065978.1 tRNA1(Val) (adenine(37)-N6)-methyltransferase [Clostridium cochlearium]MBU5269991.1 tRNA1(Val) (adenine(37)-N6)-methyltransferase [Clostridium cochlearium]MCR1972493.1 tRNA1(Val) (adenine(37)-N6)-methyltransferase [Clostridium cochlearium]NMA57453.1 tRNA1(Val) (adenine(37)-N6)-methyltransferase [Clostridium cochlearium]NME96544.1 tRNA1(Val) (adenine(37)-N6)-methyltransferase [Clostridium cochlearium]
MEKKLLIREDETLDDLQLNNIFVIQKKSGFRFGMDAVLLANFATIKKNDNILDLCSGTGIIPFIIAGKRKFNKIVGIEIQEQMVDMAKRTSIYNKLDEKIKFIVGDLKDIDLLKKLGKFDVITVNPPYKLKNSGIINENSKESIARHEILCDIDDVIKAANILLKDRGRFFMVHRPERIVDILTTMRKYKIEPKLIKLIQPNEEKSPNLLLIEGHKNGGQFLKWEKTLYVYDKLGNYTKELVNIYSENGGE